MPDSPYDSNSPNALFSRILGRLDDQDRSALEFRREMKETLSSYQAAQKTTEDKVGRLENAQWRQRGFVAAIAFGIPLFWQWMTGTPKH